MPPTDKPHLSGPRYEGDIDAIVNLLNGAKRPIIIAGNGCLHCPDELKELAEKANCPVTTTLHGMGAFDELHPLSMQMLGMQGCTFSPP